MPQTIVVNFAYLDPKFNGGTSHIGFHIAHALLEQAGIRPIFAVNAAFAPQFEQWLGKPAVILPINAAPSLIAIQLKQIERTLAPQFIVSPLFGIDPFELKDGVNHIAGMPDTLVLDHPEYFSRDTVLNRSAIYEKLRRASKVVTISQFSAAKLKQHLQLTDAQLVIAPLGAELNAKTADTSIVLEGRYWLYPANLWPHKRHDLLLRAFAAAREHDPSLQLILSGNNALFQEKFGELIQSLGLPETSVRHLGYVSESQLAALYQGAEAMVFTSAYEGFGMPLLEAMQAGCPVICAPTTAIPEVAGNAAIYVDSDDPTAWAQAALELNERREALTAAGRAHVNLFSWDYTREQWLKALVEAGMRSGTGTPAIRAVSQGKLCESAEIALEYSTSNKGRKLQLLPRWWRLQRQMLANAAAFARA